MFIPRACHNRLSFILAAIVLLTPVISSNTQAQGSEKELFIVAQRAFEDGFHDVAIRYINQLFEIYPQTQKRPEAMLILGQCYFFKGDYISAYDTFQKLFEYPQFKDATLFWLGETYLKGLDYKKALENYEQLIKAYPNSAYAPQAHYSIGWVYFEQGSFEKSRAKLQEFLKKYPTHELSEDVSFKLGEIEYNLKDHEKAIEYFQKYVRTFPNSTRHAESYFYIAEAYYYLDDALTANTYYAKVSEMAYDNKLSLMAKVSLGWGYLKLKKYGLAKQYFEEALKFSKDKGLVAEDVYLGQATLFYEAEEFANALEAYSELIKNFPNSKRIAEAYLGKANMLYQMRQYDAAVTAYQEAIDKSSADNVKNELIEKANFGLAWTYLKRGQIDESVKIFNQIKDKTENRTVKISAMTQIADAYQDYNDLEKAVEVYDQILRRYADSPYADYVQYRLGVALLKMGKIDSSILSFQSVLNNFPGSTFLKDVKYYLAVAFFKKGGWHTAKEQIDSLLKELTSNDQVYVEVQYLLGLCEYNLKNYDAASGIFQKILKNTAQDEKLVKDIELALAKTYYENGDVKDALKLFNLLINKYPADAPAEEALVWLGNHAYQNNNLQEAIAYYSQFINSFPESEQRNFANYQLGQAYRAKGDIDMAVKAFKEIQDFTDRDYFARARLAIAEIFSKDLNSEEAVLSYRNIIEASPDYKRDAYVKIAEVYKNAKEYDKAIGEYETALKSSKALSQISNVELQFVIADTYDLANQDQRAVDEYLKVPYLYPRETAWIIKAYLRAARIFEDQEKWQEAENIYKKIIEYETEELKFAQERLEWIEENVLQKKD